MAFENVRIFKAYSIAKLVNGPDDPWLHCIAFKTAVIYFIWDTREIVDVKQLSGNWEVLLGKIHTSGIRAYDTREPLIDKYNLLDKVLKNNGNLKSIKHKIFI
jgi:hypothetical protein